MKVEINYQRKHFQRKETIQIKEDKGKNKRQKNIHCDD